MSESEIKELIPAVIRDIPNAIRDLDSIRTAFNRDTIVWTQYILSACEEIARHCATMA